MIDEDFSRWTTSLGIVIHSIVPLILDRDEDVRAALISLSYAIANSGYNNKLHPYLDMIISYSVSAMNHIIQEIRLDSVGFLRVWQNAFPSAVCTLSTRVNIIASGAFIVQLILNVVLQIINSYISLLRNDWSKNTCQFFKFSINMNN
jgi:hypothetical protein